MKLCSASTVKGKLELHLIKRKNSLICENKAIYMIKNLIFQNLKFFLAISKYSDRMRILVHNRKLEQS